MPMMFKNAIRVTALSLLVGGCATTSQDPAWVKSRATAQEFYQAKDQCLQGSQRRESFSDAGDVIITNWDLFSSCLHSQGWNLLSLAKN